MLDSYKAVLLNLVNKDTALDPATAAQLQSEISSVPVESYRPEVWRLDLGVIAVRRYGTRDIDRLKQDCRQEVYRAIANNPRQKAQPDEYLISDLFPGEFEAIIIG